MDVRDLRGIAKDSSPHKAIEAELKRLDPFPVALKQQKFG